MKVYSLWRCAGSAGVYLSVESGKDTKMSEAVTILYCGKPVSAPKEVADFLEQLNWAKMLFAPQTQCLQRFEAA